MSGVIDLTYPTLIRKLWHEAEEARSVANFPEYDAARDKIFEYADLMYREWCDAAERIRWLNECLIDAEIRAAS